jgi:excisionase family DNA binding protein
MSAPPSRNRGREALFVRIPTAEAQRLDRAAFELKLSKQDLITGLVARYVDPASPTSLAALRQFGEASEADGGRRVTVVPDTLALGHHEFRPAPAPAAADVLTLADVAALLQVAEDDVEALAEAGELPGRRVAGTWRFARRAVLDWLAAGGS